MSPAPSPPEMQAALSALVASMQTGGAKNDALLNVWSRFAQFVDAVDGAARAASIARLRDHLARNGVEHRIYGAGVRQWPLLPVPVLIPASEWQLISSGIAERAAWLNRLLDDAYGPASFARTGAVPAALYAASPEFARPMVGARPGGNQWLHFYAADLARGADGQWCVLADRTQAPSGSGYALASRHAMAQTWPDCLRALDVAPLSGFFDAFRAHLDRLNRNPESPIGLLTPGPLNESAFEHAFLARGLGLDLVQNDDLIVRDGTLFVQTVTGLRRCDVLWRRIDSDYLDPLEFNIKSRLGVPGLAEAARAGHVTLVNAIGTGLTESRALRAVLPALARQHGQALTLKTATTMWGIDAQARREIAERCDEWLIGSAFGAAVPGIGSGAWRGSSLSPEHKTALLAHLAHRGADIVAQEPVTLSSTPVFEDDRFAARPFVLRVFAAFTGEGWQVMPGGLARIADCTDMDSISLQDGGHAADVWIINDVPDGPASIITGSDCPRAMPMSALSSRAADNLFWLGRYGERAEFVLRLAAAALARAAGNDGRIDAAIAAALVSAGALPGFPPGQPPLPTEMMRSLFHDPALPQNLSALVSAASAAASCIRALLPPEAAHHLSAFIACAQRDATPDCDLAARLQEARLSLAAFIARVEKDRGAIGFRYFETGRCIEHGIQTARVLARFGSDDPAAGECLRELMGGAALRDPSHPHALVFPLQRLIDHWGGDHATPASPVAAHAGALLASLETGTAPDGLHLAEELMRLSEEFAAAHIHPPEREGHAR